MHKGICFHYCFFALMLAGWPGIAQSAEVVQLAAADHDRQSGGWQSRELESKPSWGIKGDGSSRTEWMEWDNFPGSSGTYKVELGAVLESDGDSPYELLIGTEVVATGNYPYPASELDCSKNYYDARYLDLGMHVINQGETIRYRATSVYPCGSSHGQYSRFWEIKCTKVMENSDDTPPSKPQNVSQSAALHTAITLSWSASSDPQSAISGYRVLFDGVEKMRTHNTQVTIGGLSPGTTYSNVVVVAINGKLLVSDPSDPLSVTTASTQPPAGTLFIRATDGVAQGGIANASAVPGALSGEVIYASKGSTSGPDSTDSRISYTVSLDEPGTYYLMARVHYTADDANSWWISVPGQQNQILANGKSMNSWNWEGLEASATNPVVLEDVSAGEFSFTVFSREPDPKNYLDVICLSSDKAYQPRDEDVAFTALNPEVLQLGGPQRNAQYSIGDTLAIQWISDTRSVSEITIELSTNGGLSWTLLNTEGSLSPTNTDPWGKWLWPIPKTLGGNVLSCTACKVRIANYNNNAQNVVSGDFSITSATSAAWAQRAAGHVAGNRAFIISRHQQQPVLTVSGNHFSGLHVYSLTGKLLYQRSELLPGNYILPAGAGVLVVVLRSTSGALHRKVVVAH